ncbi:hypothetical protein [Sutterella wadsworthensis]|uniref:hypothetical protein n=1 Tax=Sutterella wadsworthensis TaxID=40545 RepID=UPI003967C847
MMTTDTVQFALPLDEDRPSNHIAARGCGPLAQPNAPAAQKRRFLPPAYTEARFGDPTTPEEAQLYAELNRLDGLRAKVKGAEKRRLAETFREVNAKAEKLFKGRRFWGAARPLLEHAAAELGAGGPAAADTARIMAMLALPALCRRDGITVKFKGRPQTDGRTIWLGPIDFSHPAAPIYLFGHGVHERCHVVHTNFDAAGSEAHSDPRVSAFFNLFEDIRVDALGMAECRGYRFWREALFAVLCTTGKAAFAVNGTTKLPELFFGWMLGVLEAKVLNLKLPEGILVRADQLAREKLGGGLLDEALRFVMGRLPLANTAESLSLARDLVELLSDRMRMAKKTAQVESALLSAEDEARSSPRMGAASLQLSLFDNGSETASAAAEYAVLRRLLDPTGWVPASGSSPEGEASLNPRASSCDAEAGLEELLSAITAKSEEEFDPTAAEERYAEAFARDCEQASLANAGSMDGVSSSSHILRGYLSAEIETARRAFADVWPKTSDLGLQYAEALRRRVPVPMSGAASGWDADDDLLERAVCGDDRIFLREGRAPACDAAMQILIDLSGSVGVEGGAIVRTAAVRLEEALKRTPGIHCRTAVFPDAAGRGPMLASEWETPPGGSRRVLASIPSRGPTPITQTLLWSLFSLGHRPEPTKLLILFTDGVFAADDCRAEEAALKLAGIETAAVLLNLHQTVPGRRLFEKETRVVRNAAEIPLALLDVLRDWRRRHP